MTTISIIIAIFNRKDELFELLNSLSRQTDKDFEVIVVDDGSIIKLLPTVELFEEQLDIQFFHVGMGFKTPVRMFSVDRWVPGSRPGNSQPVWDGV